MAILEGGTYHTDMSTFDTQHTNQRTHTDVPHTHSPKKSASAAAKSRIEEKPKEDEKR